jgi:hypothetical protein
MSDRPSPPFKLGQIVYFRRLSRDFRATPPNSEGPKVVKRRRWVGDGCQSGYLIDVCDVAGDQPRRWSGYDSTYFEVRK